MTKGPSTGVHGSGSSFLAKQPSKDHHGPSREEIELNQKFDVIRQVLETPDNPANTVNKLREMFGLPPLYFNMMIPEHEGGNSMPQSQSSGNRMDVEHMSPGEHGRTDVENDELLMDDDLSPVNR